jgi:3-(3-hydroxy-phenyl)propionate hydroxylase
LLHHLGVGSRLVAAGRTARRLQYRDREFGVLAEFDLGVLAGRTDHPFRLQVEQRTLTRILAAELADRPEAEVDYGSRVVGVDVDGAGVRLRVGGDHPRNVPARWVIAADGAHSTVRGSLGIPFEGETYEMRYLTVTSPMEFDRVVPDLAPVAYVSGRGEGVGLLALRDHWRAVFRVPPDEPDDEAVSPAAVQRRLAAALPDLGGDCPVVDAFLYKVHRRCAATFRHGPVVLVGDAAHLNSPTGGMGMNSGMHDAYVAATALARVTDDAARDKALDRYAHERRTVARDIVGPAADRNYREIIELDRAARQRRREDFARLVADPAATLRFLVRSSMLDSAPRP